MRIFGFAIVALGVVLAFISMSMDVSVVAGNGMRVNNIGLMADRQNYLIVSGFVVICGLLLAIFSDKLKAAPKDAEPTSQDEGINASRLDGVNVKIPIIIFALVFAFIIGSIIFYRA